MALLPSLLLAATLAAPTADFARFDRRAEAGDALTVCFFGGSLTWSANASDPNLTGFRGRMAERFRARYPRARFTFVDAAIGGTGSELGVFRVERDVLAKRPDLVFLDFICNDGGDNREPRATCCYEAILRRLIGAGVPVEQAFFTFKDWFAAGEPYEARHPRLIDYRRLVEAYGTAVGDVYVDSHLKDHAPDEIWPLDGGHPCDLGYALFAEAAWIGYERAVAAKAVCRVPERPVFGTVRDVVRRNPADGPLPPGWSRKLTFRTSAWYDGLSSRWMDDVAVAACADATPLVFETTANLIGFFGEGNASSGRAAFAVDGRVTEGPFDLDPHAGGNLMIWRRHHLADDAEARHVVEIRPMPSADGAGEIRIGSVCTARLVMNAPAPSGSAAAGLSLETLDHARGTPH